MSTSNSFSKNILSGIERKMQSIFSNPYSKVNLNWFSIKYLKHLPPNNIHHHTLLGHKTFFYGGPEYLHGLTEIFIENIYNQQLPDNAYVLDCGAHIGFSVIYIKSICPTATIVAFEPDVQNYNMLKKNILSHNLSKIDARQEAVWIEDGNINFKQEGNMGSKIEIDCENPKSSVKAVRLKTFINKKIDFLKLDIEGAEYAVLKDIEENLFYITNLFIEYHGNFSQNNELLEIFQIITRAGFKFYIKEAALNYSQPFLPTIRKLDYDVQLNIFCFRNRE